MTAQDKAQTTDTIILLDKISINDLANIQGFNWEEPIKYNESEKEAIAQKLDEYDITIVIGTWCSDSHFFVSQFVHFLNKTAYDLSKIRVFGLDKDKKSPSKIEEHLNIEFVPTFIFKHKTDPNTTHHIVEYLPNPFGKYLLENF